MERRLAAYTWHGLSTAALQFFPGLQGGGVASAQTRADIGLWSVFFLLGRETGSLAEAWQQLDSTWGVH